MSKRSLTIAMLSEHSIALQSLSVRQDILFPKVVNDLASVLDLIF